MTRIQAARCTFRASAPTAVACEHRRLTSTLMDCSDSPGREKRIGWMAHGEQAMN